MTMKAPENKRERRGREARRKTLTSCK